LDAARTIRSVSLPNDPRFQVYAITVQP
ncbi:MAG: hypothetical protein QOE03_1938, partial [Micromonosporaceae bacterium]|nr:hypothetical protein [Micromonosporaceae bacterium]